MTADDLLNSYRPIRHKGCGGSVKRILFNQGTGLSCDKCPRQWLPGFFKPHYEPNWPDHFEIDRPRIAGAIVWVLVFADVKDVLSGKKRYLKLVPEWEAESLKLERYVYGAPF